MEKSKYFERFFVAAIAKRVESSELSHSEFGRKVFGEDSGSRLWRATRDKERERSVSLSEAFRMAEALGIDFPSLVWEVSQEAKREGVVS